MLRIHCNPLPYRCADAVLVSLDFRDRGRGEWRFWATRDFWMTPGTNTERALAWVREEVAREAANGHA